MAVNTPFGQVSEEALVVGGILVVGGAFLLLQGIGGGGAAGDPPTRPVIAPDRFGAMGSATLDGPGQIPLQFHQTDPANPKSVIETGQQLRVINPYVMFGGNPLPGRQTFTTFYVIQQFGNVWAAVYASGIATNDLHANTDGSEKQNLLVNPGQPQPNGPPAPELWGYVWPGLAGGAPTAFCGGPPKAGQRADVILAIYGLQDPSCFPTPANPNAGLTSNCAPDYNGFASVLCNIPGDPRTIRRAFAFRRYPNKVSISYV